MAKIASTESGAVLAKSATIVKQMGNDMPRTWHEDKSGVASLNSEGLPNNGIDYYISSTTISETMTSANPQNKPYMVSISGKTLADNLSMLKKISDVMMEQQQSSKEEVHHKIAAVELNLACPNIVGKPTIGYDFDQMDMVLEAVSSLPCFATGGKDSPLFPLGVKLPPYFDRPHFEMAASILNKYKHILCYAASINTVGNALSIDVHAEMPSIRANGGFAGLSGPAVKYTALANVKQMRELLDDSIDVVGVGGVQSGRDAFELILCGAQAVQVGTCHWTEGPGCFDRICNELRQIMKDKGYNTVDDFRGKLKDWSKEGAAISRSARMAEKKAVESKSGEKGSGITNSSQQQMMILVAVLIGIIAMLLADKYQIVSL